MKYQNISWLGVRHNSFRGHKTYNRKQVWANAKTAQNCAKILNFKCREAGIPSPNPGAGFKKPKPKASAEAATGYKNVRWCSVNKIFKGVKIVKGTLFSSSSSTAKQCAQILNFRCRDAGIPLPNPMAGFKKPKPSAEASTGYKNVCWNSVTKNFQGQKTMKGIIVISTSKTAKQCAQILNFKCRKAGIPLPNANVGCVAPMSGRKYKKNKKKSKKTLTKRSLSKRRARKKMTAGKKQSSKHASSEGPTEPNQIQIHEMMVEVKEERIEVKKESIDETFEESLALQKQKIDEEIKKELHQYREQLLAKREKKQKLAEYKRQQLKEMEEKKRLMRIEFGFSDI